MLTVSAPIPASALRLRQLLLWVILVVFTAPEIEAQTTDIWDKIIIALNSGLTPVAVRKTIEAKNECMTTDPTSAQVKALADLLGTQGLRIPSEQQRWIRQFRCAVVLVQRDTVAFVEKRMATKVLIRSDRTRETIRVNGVSTGLTPSAFELDSGVYTISIGEGAYRRDTVLSLNPGQRVTIEISTAERAYTERPVRADIEKELIGSLVPVPARPQEPVAPARPSGGGSFLGGLLIGGGAAAGSLAPCTKLATAPSPYGGFYGGTYRPAGSAIAPLRTRCVGAAGGGAFVLGFALIHSIRKAVFAEKQRIYTSKMSSHIVAVASNERIARRNAEMIDSVMAHREELSRRRIITRAISVQVGNPN